MAARVRPKEYLVGVDGGWQFRTALGVAAAETQKPPRATEMLTIVVQIKTMRQR